LIEAGVPCKSFQHGLGVHITRIDEHPDEGGRGHKLMQQLQPFRVRIPTIATTHSHESRPAVPIDRDQRGAGAEDAVE
jgi:hypothetical protein